MNKKNAKKAIWLISGGDMQEMAAQKIKEMGYQLIISDFNPQCLCRKYADAFLGLDTFDIKGHLEAAKKIKKDYDIKAVFTAAADCHETVAILAKMLGVHGVNPQISHNCRYKLETRKILTRCGIPQPKFAEVKNLQEAKKAITKIGIPAVLKAANNAGSRGFSKIENAADLNEESLKKAIDNGTTGYAILEELLIPVENEVAEQSLETVWYNGKMYWLNWVDRLFRKDFMLFKTLGAMYENISWGVELGHINPAVHDERVKKETQDIIFKAGKALGLDKEKGGHIFKADMMLTKEGPRTIETTLRLSGGWDSSWSTPQRGADFVGGAILLALGEELNESLLEKYFKYKSPDLFCSVLSLIPTGAQDCIGRKFAGNSSFNREDSIKKAYENLLNKKYLTKAE